MARRTANCELFGRHAEYFEAKVVPLWGHVYGSLIERSRITPGSRVLDVGAGTGETAIRAAKLTGRKGNVLGIDVEEGMLEVARRKNRRLGYTNLEFRQMSVEDLELPAKSFDFVIGNYSICCVRDYNAALRECLRVLRKGGRLTFNQSGPADPLGFTRTLEIFEKYKSSHPSKRLQGLRKANLAQKNAVDKFRDPFLTLQTMRDQGFRETEATITVREIRYRNPEAYLDRMLNFSWRNEAEEMTKEEVTKFRAEATTALLTKKSGGPGFVMKDDMVFYTGVR